MFGFISTIFTKVTSLVASAIIAVGLISTPTQEVVVSSNIETEKETKPAVIKNLEKSANDNIKKEIDELRVRLVEEQQKRKDLENKINQPKPVTIASEPVTTTSKPTTPTTFTTPSGAVLDQLGNIISLPKNQQSNPGQVQQIGSISQEHSIAIIKELSTSEIAQRILPAIVHVETFTTTSEGDGSGFLIEGDGLILTAAHVVHGFSSVQVTLHDGKIYSGKVLGRNDFYDVALVKINANNLAFISLGNSDDITIGENILVFGHPLGIAGAVLSKGILNGKQPGKYFVWLQTDAKTQGGSSGGPWIDKQGEAIGIHLRGYGPLQEGMKINEGFNFSVPINSVKTLLSFLKQGQSKIKYDLFIPPINSKIEIKRSVKASADLNPTLLCDKLGTVSTDKDLFLCKLYRTYLNSYVWELVDEYTSDNFGYEEDPQALLGPPPSLGSTITIFRSTVASIEFNPTLTCDQLSTQASEKDKCKLYKNYKSSYTWNVVDN